LPSRIPGAFAVPSEQAGDGASRSRPPLGATHRAGNGVPPRVPRFSQAVMWTPSVEAHAPECAPVALPNGGFAMDEKKKDAGPERVGSWKAASPTGTSVGDRSDGSAASGFIASRPRWEPDVEADEEMDGATMDGGAITTGAAPIGAMPEEDDVSGAARTADFTRGTSGASGDASAHGASWAPSSAGDGARADAVREAIRDRESSGSGSEGFGLEETDAGDSATRTFAGFGEDRGSRQEESGSAEKLKEKASEAQRRAADAGREAQQRVADMGQKAGGRISEAGHKASAREGRGGQRRNT